jgi:molecular chaperone GrpE
MVKKDEHNEEVNEEIEKDLEEEQEQVQEEAPETSELEKEIEEYKTSLARLQADFVNYKKRTEREKQNLINYGIENFVCELLPILDNFQRAMESEIEQENEFYKGIEMIENQLIELLRKHGVKEIESLDENFDPNCHNAIVLEDVEGVDEGIVTGVLQKGYTLNDKVIRPSMVKVSK